VAVVKFLEGTGEKAHRDKEQVHTCAGQRGREETRPLPVHRVRARKSLTSAYTLSFFMALSSSCKKCRSKIFLDSDGQTPASERRRRRRRIYSYSMIL
jgi:hypothetical protein